MRAALRMVAALPCAAVVAGCGGETPPAREPEPVHLPTPNRASRGGAPSVSQELGQLDPKAVEAAFARVMPKVLACQTGNLKRVDYLAGDAKVFVRLDATGKVKWIYLEESTLGDRATERCVVDVLTRAPWPAPEGGEGELRKGLGFDLQDAREPTAWGEDKLGPARAEAGAAAARCRGGRAEPRFQVTAYVEPDGDHGKVASVGVASPSRDGAEQLDCVADAVRGLRLPSPGGYAAKITFSL